MKTIGCLVTIVIGFIIGPIWAGYIMTIMWGWFLIPLHMPAISIPEAIGIALTVRMLVANSSDPKNEKQDQTKMKVLACSYALGFPLLMLAFGYIVHLFM